jgi:hypothetical protein
VDEDGEHGHNRATQDDYDNDSSEDDSDDSTWNMELPNVADLSIDDSSTTDIQGRSSIIWNMDLSI